MLETTVVFYWPSSIVFRSAHFVLVPGSLLDSARGVWQRCCGCAWLVLALLIWGWVKTEMVWSYFAYLVAIALAVSCKKTCICEENTLPALPKRWCYDNKTRHTQRENRNWDTMDPYWACHIRHEPRTCKLQIQNLLISRVRMCWGIYISNNERARTCQKEERTIRRPNESKCWNWACKEEGSFNTAN